MFRVFVIFAWAVLLVILLYLWAEIREIAMIVRENKRELLRRNLSGRASETFPNFQEEDQKEREREQQRSREETEERSQEQGRKTRGMTLNASEEQVLDEVLTEFLG